jgi:hypothetical protein
MPPVHRTLTCAHCRAQGADGKLHTLVAASRMGWLHLLDVASNGGSGKVQTTLENIDAKRMVFCPK